MTVYVDELLAVNFALDYALLRGAALISGVPARRWRAAAGAAAGALYAAAGCLPGAAWLGALPVRAAAGAGLCAAAFAGKRAGRRGFLRTTGCFFALAAAAGGAVETLARSGGGRFGPAGTGRLPIWLTGILFAAAWLGLTLVFRRPGLYGAVRRQVRRAEIRRGDRRVCVSALTDTGCVLRDPALGGRVLLLRPAAAAALLPPEAAEGVLRGEPPERTAARGGGLRLLAVSGAAGGGLLLGFTADSVRLDGREQGRMTVAAAPGLDRGGEEALIGL